MDGKVKRFTVKGLLEDADKKSKLSDSFHIDT